MNRYTRQLAHRTDIADNATNPSVIGAKVFAILSQSDTFWTTFADGITHDAILEIKVVTISVTAVMNVEAPITNIQIMPTIHVHPLTPKSQQILRTLLNPSHIVRRRLKRVLASCESIFHI
jgi:hypothetical protein